LVRFLSASLPVPVFGNGDVVTSKDALTRLVSSSAFGVMIGRGALQDPFLFARSYSAWKKQPFPEPSYEEEALIRLELLDDIASTYDSGRAASRIRKLLPYLLHRYPFARRTGLDIGRLQTPFEQISALRAFFSGKPLDNRPRFEDKSLPELAR
jgi:tRNA-dihydrouridine synthase